MVLNTNTPAFGGGLYSNQASGLARRRALGASSRQAGAMGYTPAALEPGALGASQALGSVKFHNRMSAIEDENQRVNHILDTQPALASGYPSSGEALPTAPRLGLGMGRSVAGGRALGGGALTPYQQQALTLRSQNQQNVENRFEQRRALADQREIDQAVAGVNRRYNALARQGEADAQRETALGVRQYNSALLKGYDPQRAIDYAWSGDAAALGPRPVDPLAARAKWNAVNKPPSLSQFRARLKAGDYSGGEEAMMEAYKDAHTAWDKRGQDYVSDLTKPYLGGASELSDRVLGGLGLGSGSGAPRQALALGNPSADALTSSDNYPPVPSFLGNLARGVSEQGGVRRLGVVQSGAETSTQGFPDDGQREGADDLVGGHPQGALATPGASPSALPGLLDRIAGNTIAKLGSSGLTGREGLHQRVRDGLGANFENAPSALRAAAGMEDPLSGRQYQPRALDLGYLPQVDPAASTAKLAYPAPERPYAPEDPQTRTVEYASALTPEMVSLTPAQRWYGGMLGQAQAGAPATDPLLANVARAARPVLGRAAAALPESSTFNDSPPGADLAPGARILPGNTQQVIRGWEAKRLGRAPAPDWYNPLAHAPLPPAAPDHDAALASRGYVNPPVPPALLAMNGPAAPAALTPLRTFPAPTYQSDLAPQAPRREHWREYAGAYDPLAVYSQGSGTTPGQWRASQKQAGQALKLARPAYDPQVTAGALGEAAHDYAYALRNQTDLGSLWGLLD